MNNQHQIDDLISKYLCGEASPEEAIQMDDWLTMSTENNEYFEAMAKSFALVNNQNISKPNAKKAWNKFIQEKVNNHKTRIYYGIVAVLVLGLLTILIIINREEKVTILIAEESEINQGLPDQSDVDLSQNSQISYESGFGKLHRRLSFSGKATFTVKHNNELPFIIESSGIYLEDLGTQFIVENRPESDTLFLIVNEGIVRLFDELGNEVVVKASEKAWYIKSAKKIITDADSKVIKFDFKDTQLIEVLALLKDAYDIDIELSPSTIGQCKITTQFFDEELATIITIITETLGFKYSYQNHRFIIEGKPCQ